MINALITWSLKNRIVVLLMAAAVAAYGIYAVKNTPVDAIPDLSENQVIIFTDWMGRSPDLVEDQIPHPRVRALPRSPGVNRGRGERLAGAGRRLRASRKSPIARPRSGLVTQDMCVPGTVTNVAFGSTAVSLSGEPLSRS